MPTRKAGGSTAIRDELLHWARVSLDAQRVIEDMSGRASPIADKDRALIQKLNAGAEVIVTADELGDALRSMGQQASDLHYGVDYRVAPDGAYAVVA